MTDARILSDFVEGEGIYFLDFEASSLDPASWPVEIGLAWVEGSQVTSDARLIRPEPVWPIDAWSHESATIHGISLDCIKQNGKSAADVARWFAVNARGIGITDAPEFEARWLRHLLEAIPKAERPAVRLLDFDSYVAATTPGSRRLDRVYAELDALPAPHRAAADAARLAAAWLAGRS